MATTRKLVANPRRVYLTPALFPTTQYINVATLPTIFGGGPDRIRTGDLGLDRAACWATTLRVQLNYLDNKVNGDSMVAYAPCQQGLASSLI